MTSLSVPTLENPGLHLQMTRFVSRECEQLAFCPHPPLLTLQLSIRREETNRQIEN